MNLNDKIQPKLDEISKEVYNQLKKNNFVRIVHDKQQDFLATPMVDNLYNRLATIDYIKKDIIEHVQIYDKYRKK